VINEALAGAADLVRQADGLIVTAGAGMGVDSGLPDFRGEGGFWKHYPALGRAGLGFTSIACPDAFRRTPKLAWGFYGHRLRLYRETVPNDGFHILRRWAAGMKHGAFVVTSNVDGQFQKVGLQREIASMKFTAPSIVFSAWMPASRTSGQRTVSTLSWMTPLARSPTSLRAARIAAGWPGRTY
jgi:hypothetical protein